VTYIYGTTTSIDDVVSRPTALALTQTIEMVEELVPFVEYQHVGMGMFATVNYPMVGSAEYLKGVQLDRTLWYQPGDPPFVPVGSRRFDPLASEDDLRGIYPGWDRFGRIKAQAWVDGVLTVHAEEESFPNRPPIVLETYAYDKASNPISRYDSRPGAHLTDRDFQFGYDGLNRLIGSVRGDDANNDWNARGTQVWTLDMLGNWSEFRWDKNGDEDFADASETDIRDHNSANEISARTLDNPSPPDTSVPVTYDKAGNVRLRYETALLRMELTHDAWNRLVRVRRPTGNIEETLNVSEHEYNGLHWRVVSRRDTDSPPDGEIDERRGIIYSGNWQVLEEFVESEFDPEDVDEPIAADHRMQQFWGLRHIDDAVMLRRQANTTGGEIERTSFQLTDRQFSVVAVLDVTSALMERVTYDPYGRAQHRWPGDFNGDGYSDGTDTAGMSLFTPIGDPAYKADEDLDRDGYIDIPDLVIAASVWSGHGPLPSGQISDPVGPANRVGYAGYRFEPTSSLYHVRFRWYDTGLGRWMERDPAGYLDGMSAYEYVKSAPSLSNDSFGLCSRETSNKLRLIVEAKDRNCNGLPITEADAGDILSNISSALNAANVYVDDRTLANGRRIRENLSLAGHADEAARTATTSALRAGFETDATMFRSSAEMRVHGAHILRGAGYFLGVASSVMDVGVAADAFKSGDSLGGMSATSSAALGLVTMAVSAPVSIGVAVVAGAGLLYIDQTELEPARKADRASRLVSCKQTIQAEIMHRIKHPECNDCVSP